jgi:hypothetical protein
MSDDDLGTKLNQIEQAGRTRFGDDFDVAVQAIKRAIPGGGIPENEMRQLANSADPAGLLMNLGRHCLMDAASNGDKEAEAAYTKIRQAERKAHAEYKGRVY